MIQKTYPDNTIPQPLDSLPAVSLLPGILRKSPFYFLSEAAREHGGFVRLRIGGKSVYLVSDARLFQHVLRDNVQNYRKSPFLYNAARPMVGNGLLTSEGDFWLRQRRMIQPQFHRQRIASFATMMTNATDDVMRVWNEQPETEVEMGARMAQITVEIVSRTLFGTATLTPDAIASLGQDMVAAANYVALRGYMPFIPQSVPVPGSRRFHRAMSRLTEAVNTIITAGEQNRDDDDNLITMLLHTVDTETNERMSHAQLFDEVMTVFSAGFETTATALTWIWYLLAQYPQVEQQLRDEVASVLGNRVPTLDDLPRLEYCRQALLETMRYYPPIPMLPRTALEDDAIEGYVIPKDTILLMFYYGLHHNPEYWNDPEVFDPSRFASQQSASRHRFAYLPFSAGPRQCIGNEFAMMEGTLVLAMLLQRYRITLSEGQSIVPNLSATLKPRPDIRAAMQRLV
jgi:cytochrome P450